MDTIDRTGIYALIDAERGRQDAQWGGAEHDDQHDNRDWLCFIFHQLGAAGWSVGRGDPVGYRNRLVKIAALAVSAIEAFDRTAMAAACAGDRAPEEH